MAILEPLLDTHIADMDASRITFIDALNLHVLKLREELRISEIILQSVIKSLSKKNDKMTELDKQLHKERMESSLHEPVVLSEQQLEQMQLALIADRATKLPEVPVTINGAKTPQQKHNRS